MSRSHHARLAHRFATRAERLSRRDVLKAALAASAGVLIASCASRPSRKSSSNARVLIVGAGFAGLACAHELSNAGFDVCVLEARRRVGGRVMSLRDFVPGKYVEGGGELIGSNHSTWLAFAQRFELSFLDTAEDEDAESPIFLRGHRLSKSEAEDLYHALDATARQMNALAEPIDSAEPWKSAGALALDRQSCAQWIAALDASDLCKHALDVEWTTNNGVATERQSLLAQLAQVKGGGLEKYWTDTELYRCAGGNDQLATAIANELGSERLRLGCAVRSIRVDDSHVRAESGDGATFYADHLVLCIPPSVWQRIEFTPALPSILQPQMGTSIKYIASLTKRYWSERGMSADALSDGDVASTWEATRGQLGDDRAALTCFSSGPSADVCRKRTGEERQGAYRSALEELLPGFGEHFTSARFMDWPSDPWTLAGYSFPAPGEVTTIAPLWRTGLGRLQFAGEHTSTRFPGYMEGALESGVAAARNIVHAELANGRA